MSKTWKDKKKWVKKQQNKLSANDIAFRNLDAEARHTWLLDDENYTRDERLDWWLEFGFPSALDAALLEVISEIVMDIKFRKVSFSWV